MIIWLCSGKKAARFLGWALGWTIVLPAYASLTIAAFNVENYVVADRMVDGVYHQAYPKPETEKDAVNQVVAGIAPDILAVEEMGPQPYLDDFQRELNATGQNFPFTALLEAVDAERHVAILSKIPFKAVQRYAQLPTKYAGRADRVKRGVLEVVIATQQGDCSIFVIHLKSRFTDHPDDPESALQRAAEAEAVRAVVLARYPDPTQGRFVICGDWNDTRNSRPVRALQKRGATSLGEILNATDSRGETWTHYYHKEDSYSRIDYLLVSPGLSPFVADGKGRIWDGAGADLASDHRAVYLRLNLDVFK